MSITASIYYIYEILSEMLFATDVASRVISFSAWPVGGP